MAKKKVGLSCPRGPDPGVPESVEIQDWFSVNDHRCPGLFAKDNAGKLAVTSFCLSFINIDIYLLYRPRLINLVAASSIALPAIELYNEIWSR